MIWNKRGIFTGWYIKDNIWYYTKEDLTQATGFNQINGQTYYFDGTGRMQTGWRFIDNTWYWFNNSGFMRTGWLLLGNTWYYFESDGKMVTGWKKQLMVQDIILKSVEQWLQVIM